MNTKSEKLHLDYLTNTKGFLFITEDSKYIQYEECFDYNRNILNHIIIEIYRYNYFTYLEI